MKTWGLFVVIWSWGESRAMAVQRSLAAVKALSSTALGHMEDRR